MRRIPMPWRSWIVYPGLWFAGTFVLWLFDTPTLVLLLCPITLGWWAYVFRPSRAVANRWRGSAANVVLLVRPLLNFCAIVVVSFGMTIAYFNFLYTDVGTKGFFSTCTPDDGELIPGPGGIVAQTRVSYCQQIWDEPSFKYVFVRPGDAANDKDSLAVAYQDDLVGINSPAVHWISPTDLEIAFSQPDLVLTKRSYVNGVHITYRQPSAQ